MKEKIGQIKEILRGQRPVADVWHYALGNYRYYFWYGGKLSKKYAFIAWLRKRVIRKFIKEQIEFRIKWMNPICYEQGSCIKCGCETTALQMANKACEGHCYPTMMSKKDWRMFITGKHVHKDTRVGIHWRFSTKDKKPFIYFKR